MPTPDDTNALRQTLEACLFALNDARNFAFHPGRENPLGLKVSHRGTANSYDLAARVAFVLNATKKEH